MTMRPFYRSRLFWLGVPGLVFLLWVWWDSGKYESTVQLARGDTDHKLLVSLGRVGWSRMKEWRPGPVTMDYFGTERLPLPPDAEEEKDGLRMRSKRFDLAPVFERYEWPYVSRDLRQEMRVMEVGIWVVVASYGVLWLGAVCGWQCWKRKRMVKDLMEAEAA